MTKQWMRMISNALCIVLCTYIILPFSISRTPIRTSRPPDRDQFTILIGGL